MTLLAALTIALATGSSAWLDTPEPETIGPKLLCFKYSSFQLLEGERVTDVRIGIHAMVIEVDGPAGRYTVAESDNFRRPASLGTWVARSGGTTYHRSGNPPSYAVTGRTSYSTERDVLVLWVSGSALNGRRTDAAVFTRVMVGDPAPLPCDYRYLYGFDVFLGQDE